VQPPKLNPRFLNRIRDANARGSYAIADKFIEVSARLAGDSADSEIDEFIELNKRRNSLFHTGSNTSLPTERVRVLLKRYLRLHLETLTP
jgi:translation initiation factor 2B subunit (eIF-2B alpha/beta/delta family)